MESNNRDRANAEAHAMINRSAEATVIALKGLEKRTERLEKHNENDRERIASVESRTLVVETRLGKVS